MTCNQYAIRAVTVSVRMTEVTDWTVARRERLR